MTITCSSCCTRRCALEDGQMEHRELNQFLGPRYLVTVHERTGTVDASGRALETISVLDRLEAGSHPSDHAGRVVVRHRDAAVGSNGAMVSDLASRVAALERPSPRTSGTCCADYQDQ